MNKLFCIVLLALAFVSCKRNVKEEVSGGVQVESVFKVVGINDSLKANSVSMIIRLDGIESVYLNKSDSIVSVKADKSIINKVRIKDEIEKCGVEVIKVY